MLGVFNQKSFILVSFLNGKIFLIEILIAEISMYLF